MYILGPYESFHYWLRTGVHPRHIASKQQKDNMERLLLFPLPTVVPDANELFASYCPTIDAETELFLKSIGLETNHLETIVHDDCLRRNAHAIACKTFHMTLSERSFVEIHRGVFVCAPWLCLLLLARDKKRYSTPALLVAADQLCSRYGHDHAVINSLVETQERVQLTSTQNIADALNSYRLLNSRVSQGYNRLMGVLQFACDGARSPMEIISAISLAWDPSWGGTGFSQIKLNEKIALDSDEQRISGKSYLEVDLTWENSTIVVEYKGNVHDNDHALQSDSVRETILKGKGYQVEELTSSLVNDLHAFNMVALRVATALGKKLPDSADFHIRQNALHKEITNACLNGI